MVFTSLVNYVRTRGPDRFWRNRKIFKLSAHFTGRIRNCYSNAIRIVHRSLVYATKGRKLKKADMIELWEARLAGSCTPYGITRDVLQNGLAQQDILINKKALSDLAIWEPRSFEALVKIAQEVPPPPPKRPRPYKMGKEQKD